jgi:GMP synthase-like glutamine amidotransferase
VHPNQAKLLGVEESRLVRSRLLPGVASLRVVVSHCEEVKRAPADYRVTAQRGPIAIDGLEHCRRPIFSFQFHPEAGGEFADHAGLPRAALDARQVADSERVLGAFRRFAAHPAD